MSLSRLVAVLALVVTATSRTASATDVGGPILADTTWTLAGSPYIVTQSIIVGGNATLTIQPGVTVKFNSGRGMIVGDGAWGIGTLRAIGTADQKITFTSNTNPGQPGQWLHIFFTNFCIDAAFDGSGQYLSGSTLQHCIVEYAGGGAAGTGAVSIGQSSPFINFCEVRNNARSGICANNTTTPPLAPTLQIKNSNIHHNGAGSNQSGGGANLSITGLLFTGNALSNNAANSGNGGGIYAAMTVTGGSCMISGNVVLNNSVTGSNSSGGGIYAELHGNSGTYMFTDNTIATNGATGINGGGGGVFLLGTGSNSTYTIAGNTISTNSATNGGGVWAQLHQNTNQSSFSSNTISNNTAVGNGGGSGGGMLVYVGVSSLVTLQNNNVFGNLARDGGGLCLLRVTSGLSQVTLTGNTFANNRAIGIANSNGSGGGIYILNGVGNNGLILNLASNTITGNVADGGPTGGSGLGGGLFVTETQTTHATSVSLAGNQTNGTFNVVGGNIADFGDAIYNNMLYHKSGENNIQAGFVCWGGLNPNPVSSPNLIYDSFDDATKSYVLYGSHVADSICTSSPVCGPGLIPDCNGNCAPVSWVGDGLCDNGFYAYNGVPIFFDCQQFGNDGGDCASPQPPIMNPPNHGDQETAVPYNPPAPPAPTQNKLILVTHGWNTDSQGFGFWQEMRDRIAASVGPDWKVEAYSWTLDSLTGPPPFGPEFALANAATLGFGLGEALADQGYQHVHFIAHSAGSALIAAAASRLSSTGTTVHTTYLDAYTGIFSLPGLPGFEQAYGGNAVWSDHYVARDLLTGDLTDHYLPLVFNVDVSLVDSNYLPIIGSSHSWPRCFYNYTINSTVAGSCDAPDGVTMPYGLPLSFEKWTGPNGFNGWMSERLASFGPNGDDPVLLGGGTAAASMMLDINTGPSLDLESTESFPSSLEGVQLAGGTMIMTTQSSGAMQPSPAWINFRLFTDTAVNFVSFEMVFTGDPGAAGLLTMYVDGTKCGVVDEPYALAGIQFYRLPTPGDLAPGEHFLSFRLDHFNQLTSSVTIENVATGFGEFVPACRADFDENGTVAVPDIFGFLSAWFAQDPHADFDGVPGITVPDIFAFLSAWFAGCP